MANPYAQFVTAPETDAPENPYAQFSEDAPVDGPVDFDFRTMIENVPDSGAQFIDDITFPFRHPIVTYGALENLALGVAEKAGFDIAEGDQAQYVDAVGQHIKNRYGSMDNFKTSLMNDPVGVASDIGGLFTGGAGLAAKVPGLAKVAKAADVVGEVVDPVRAATRATKTAARPIAQRVDVNDMMQEVLKFGTTKAPGDRAAWAQVALDERLVPNQAAVQKLQGRIDDLGAELNRGIDSPAGNTAAVPPERVLANLPELRERKGGFRIGAADDVDYIDNFMDEFIAEHGAQGPVTARQLQDLKTDAYNQINWNTRRQTGTPIQEEVTRATARGAKEAIEEVLPEVGPLNRELGSLLDAQAPLEQAIGRISNRNKIPLSGAVLAGGATAAEPVAGAATLLGSTLYSPGTKARFAIILDQLAKNGGNADLVDSRLLKGLTNDQVRQLVIQSGRLGQEEQPY